MRDSLHLAERTELCFAALQAHNGKRTELAERIQHRFGMELPFGPQRTSGSNFSILGAGPATWWVTYESGVATLPALINSVGDLAAIVDQSDGFDALRLTGPGARELLRMLVPIDVHPRAFAVNHVAMTVAAHMHVMLWRLPDEHIHSPAFEIAAPRSYTASFRHAVLEAAEAYRCRAY